MEKDKVLELVRRLVEDGVFDGDGKMLSLEPEQGSEKGAQFSSELSLLNLTILRPSGHLEVIPIVIKLQFSSPDVRPDNAVNFYNEDLTYREILPALNTSQIKRYPKVYHSYSDSGKDHTKDIIIMENLKTYGFQLSKVRLFLDYDYILTALKALGQFHSWSYSLKHINNNKFIDLCNIFKKPDPPPERWNEVTYQCMKKGIQPLLDKGAESDVLLKFLKCANKVLDMYAFLMKPTEKFGVIIHGDFNNNNLFYKYNDKGKPIDTALFDFQFTKYASPVYDLVFFLYMNTTRPLREEHWNDFLKIYWDAVKSNTSEDVVLPKYEEFLNHLASRAVLGFFTCSFFIPMMLAENILDVEEFSKLSEDQQMEYNLSLADKHISYVVDIAYHLLEHKYFQSFIKFYDENYFG